MAGTYNEYLDAAQAYEAAGEEEKARRMFLAAEKIKAANPESVSVERSSSRFSDISQGVGAGIVDFFQGSSELVTETYEYATDKPATAPVTEFFEGTKDSLGLTPESTPGVVAEELTNLGLGYIVTSAVIGAIAGGPAGLVAGGVVSAARALRSGRTVGAAVQAVRARRALAARSAIIARTAGKAGLAEMIFSPEGRPTVSDSFDALPGILSTEEVLAEKGGRLRAAKAFRNRLRYGAEAATATGILDASLTLFGVGARAAGSLPYVSPVTSKLARGTIAAFEAAGKAIDAVPGGSATKKLYHRYLTASGGVRDDIFQLKQDALNRGKTQVDLGTQAYQQWTKAARKVIVAQASWKNPLKNLRPTKMAEARNDLMAFLEGDKTAMKSWPAHVRKAAERLRDLTDSAESKFLEELRELAATLPDGSQLEGVRKHIAEIEAIKAQRNSHSSISGVRAQQFGHLIRLYELYEQPVKFWKNFKWNDPLVREVTEDYKKEILAEIRQAKGVIPSDEALELAAQSRLESLLKVEGKFAGRGLGWKEIARGMAKAARVARKDRITLSPADRAQLPLDVSSLISRENLTLNQMKILGQVRDPEQLVSRTLARNASLAAHAKFNRIVANNPDWVVNKLDLEEVLAAGGRPAVVETDIFTTGAGKPLKKLEEYSSLTDLRAPKVGGDELLRASGFRQLHGEVDYPTRIMKGDPEPSPLGLFGGEYGQLSGKWVSDELYDSLTVVNRLGNSGLNDAAAMAMWAKAFSQQMTVVQNPLSQVRNFLGNFLFLGANANITRDMHILDHIQLFSRSLANLSDEGIQQKIKELTELGLVDNALATSQIRALKQMSSDLAKNESLEHFVTNQLIDKIPIMRFLNERYASVDSMFKSMAFSAEESKLVTALSKSGLDLADPEIENLMGKAMWMAGLVKRLESKVNPEFSWVTTAAADLVKDTMPNYPRVGKLVRGLDSTPFFGAFTSFASESIRNSVNTVAHGIKQMAFRVPKVIRDKLAKKLGGQAAADAAVTAFEREIRAQGANRVANYLAVAVVGPEQIARASQRAAGMSDEQADAALSMQPSFLSGHAIQFIKFVSGERVEYIDQSYVNPYGFAQDAARAAFRKYAEQGRLNASEAEQLLAGAWEGLSSFAEPFLGESLVFERLMDVWPQGRAGRTQMGAKIYSDTEGESLGDKISKSALHVLAGFIPGFAREFATVKGGKFQNGRLTRAMLEAAGLARPGGQGQEFDLGGEFARAATGFTPMELNLKRDFYYSGKAYLPGRSAAKTIANHLVKDNSASVPQMVAGWNKYLDRLYEIQSKLYADVEAARALGMEDSDIRRHLIQGAKLGKTEVNRIMRGEFYPKGVSDEVRKEVRREIREGWPRRETDIPWRLFNSLSRDRSLEKLNPRIFKDMREAEAAAKTEAAAEAAQPVAAAPPPPAPPQTAPAAPAPVQTAATSPPPVAPAPLQQAAAESLLGSTYSDRIKNMGIRRS